MWPSSDLLRRIIEASLSAQSAITWRHLQSTFMGTRGRFDWQLLPLGRFRYPLSWVLVLIMLNLRQRLDSLSSNRSKTHTPGDPRCWKILTSLRMHTPVIHQQEASRSSLSSSQANMGGGNTVETPRQLIGAAIQVRTCVRMLACAAPTSPAFLP